MSAHSLRALILEDSQSDALLLLRELRRGGYEVEHVQVQTAPDLKKALETAEWDVILSDYSMPGFDAPEALSIVREQKQLDIPFIIVSGTIGEDLAVAAMKAGAADYFSKEKLTRLVPAVEREVRDAAHRRKRREAEAELRKAEERFSKAFHLSPAGILIARLSDGVALAASQRFIEMSGKDESAIIGKSGPEASFWVDDEQRKQIVERLQTSGMVRSVEVAIRRSSGNEVYALLSAELIELDNEPCILAFFQDVTELKRAQDEVLETKNLLEKTFRSLTEAVMVIDATTRTIQMCNPAVETIFGYSPEELIGQSTEILHVNREMYENFGTTGDPVLVANNTFQIEYQMGHKDGHIIHTENTVASLDEEEGFIAGVVSVVRDITDRKIAEERQQRFVQRLQLLHDIDRGILAADEPHLIAQTALQQLKRMIPYFGASVMTFDEQFEHATYIAVESEGESPWKVGDSIVVENRLAVEQFQQNEPYMVQDTEELEKSPSPAERQLIESGIRSYVNMPLISHGRLLGTLNLRSIKPRAFSSQTIEVVQEIAAQLAIAIRNAQLLETERRRNAELTALHQASLQLTSSLEMQTVMDTILDYAILLVDAVVAHIFFYDGEELTFGTAFWDGKKQSQPFSEPRTDGFTHTVAQTGQRLIIPDMNQHPLYADQPWGGAIIGLPLQVAGTTNGVMSVAYHIPHYFNEQEVRVLELLADQTAIAIQNAQLYEQIQEHADQLEQRVAERTAELQHQNERIETILRSSSDAILLLAHDGSIIQANRAFCTIFDCDEKAVEGEPLTSVARIEQFDQLQESLRNVVERRTAQRIELTAFRTDNESFEVDIVLSPVENGRGEQQEIVCSMRDITVRKQVEVELRRALEREKELNELKSGFTSLVSHEFRTPLAVILSASETISRYFDRLTPEYRHKKLDLIKGQVKHLTNLIDDVLLIGKTDQVGLKFDPQRQDAVALCEEITDEFTIDESSDVAIQFVHEGSCSDQYIDASLFRHILQNLVSNAVKYSPKGGKVTLSLNCTDTQTIVVVADEGIGIPEKDQQQLFTPFHRATNVGEIQGTGFGLAIVKRAVERHGGTIEFTSVEGQGTTFTVRLRSGHAKSA